MMEEGEPEVHTTQLTALSAAEKTVMEDELTTSLEGQDFVMEVQPELSSNHSQKIIQLDQQQQNEQPPVEQQQNPTARFQPFYKTISAVPSFLPVASFQDSRAFFSPSLTPVIDDSSSILSSLPDFSLSKQTTLDFTAAWVASTPFADAPSTPSLSSTPPDNDLGGRNDETDCGAQPPPQFVTLNQPVVTTTETTSKTARATMVGSLSGRKIRPTMTMGIAQQQRQHHSLSHVGGKVGNGDDRQPNSPLFLQNHQPQFITPTYNVTRFPTSGQLAGNDNNNAAGNGNNNAASLASQQSTTPYFFPTVGRGGANASVVYDAPATASHLGRHWKQMGCQTRQYVQPSIPLPASVRLASAAKQLRIAGKGATFLGGPPGSLSPLTPNKSWAQVVASSTPQQQKNQQQQPPPKQFTAVNSTENGSTNVAHFTVLPHSRIATPTPGLSYNQVVAAAAPPPPPLFSGNGGKTTKSATLRGLAGLGGVSTSSNRDFKSLLLRLKTVLEKEKEKWRPKAFVTGHGVSGSGEGVGSEIRVETENQTATPCGKSVKSLRGSIDGKQRDDCMFWLAWILRKLQFSAETMALSVALFDALIVSSGKAESTPPSTLVVTAANCKLVALVCLLLSAKFSEEDADVPTTKDFLRVSEINNGVVDVLSGVVTVELALKMERVILTALEWDLNRPTPLKFLEILHTLLLCHQPQLLEDVALNLTPAKHLQRLTWKMQKIVANHQLALSYRPAVLAVSLLSVDLESIGVADWRVVSNALEKICQIGHSVNSGEDRHKISRCKNLIVRLLDGVDRNVASKGSMEGGYTQSTVADTGAAKRIGAKNVEDRMKEKRSMVKLKRKHVPSESGGVSFVENANVTSETTSNASSTSSIATFPSTSSASSTSSRTTLKRVFSIAESPTCKSEARSEEEAVTARGGLSAAERFQALQGLCINIY